MEKKIGTIGIIGYILGYNILRLYWGYSGKENGNYRFIGLYRDNCKENGNYY